MKWTTVLAGTTTAALILTTGVTNAAAHPTGHRARPGNSLYTCRTTRVLGSTCWNNGGNAHGTVRWCQDPDDVVIVIGYYGHVHITFSLPFPATKHFWYGGAPWWDDAFFDNNDSEKGPKVVWHVAGPAQDYVGQNHLLYDIHAYCDMPDGPKKPAPGMSG